MINGTVLLIHDDKKVCDMAKAAVKSLKNKGRDFDLLITSSAEEAVRLIDKNSDIFSIIIGLGTIEPEKRLNVACHVRRKLQNKTVSITIHCNSREIRERLNIYEKDIMAYIETAELDEEKLYYLIISAESYYRNASFLNYGNNILKIIINIMSSFDRYKNTEDAILMNFQDTLHFFNDKLNIPTNVLSLSQILCKLDPDIE